MFFPIWLRVTYCIEHLVLTMQNRCFETVEILLNIFTFCVLENPGCAFNTVKDMLVILSAVLCLACFACLFFNFFFNLTC